MNEARKTRTRQLVIKAVLPEFISLHVPDEHGTGEASVSLESLQAICAESELPSLPASPDALAWWKSYWDRNGGDPTDEDIAFALDRYAAREWVPVGERLPEQNKEYLVQFADSREPEIYYFGDGVWWTNDEGFPASRKVTHWQPLPAAADVSVSIGECRECAAEGLRTKSLTGTCAMHMMQNESPDDEPAEVAE